MGERTDDGYVFRTDLRLRPDPGSTPPVVSRLAALAYYESAGQNWERAALIKARPVAGDRAAGAAFLAELTPFLWRKHLDFAAIQDIHSIKRQIDAHRGGGGIKVAGHNVKLGRGGIREIEFFAQTQQLIWGGRMPELRARGNLRRAGRARRRRAASPTTAAAELDRGLSLPAPRRASTADGGRRADPYAARRRGGAAITSRVFLGFAVDRRRSPRELTRAARARSSATTPSSSRRRRRWRRRGNLVFTGIEDDPETLETLRAPRLRRSRRDRRRSCAAGITAAIARRAASARASC